MLASFPAEDAKNLKNSVNQYCDWVRRYGNKPAHLPDNFFCTISGSALQSRQVTGGC
jgi:hypothetical protein